MTEYPHPEIVLHVPDFYGPWDGKMHKWKDRFNTTIATSATSLIRYLEWPGDKRRPDWVGGQRKDFPDATELGPFAIYRIDHEATAKLRAEMEAMNPAGRTEDPKPGHWIRPSSKKFAAELREAIKRAIA